MDYIKHLRHFESMSGEEQDERRNELIQTTPEKCWPEGMPASIDPKLVLIGVSYGNSPSIEAEDSYKKDGSYFFSEPCVVKPDNSHFYYPDTRRYWLKLRYLSHSYFKMHDSNITENEAISLTSHFNLGTGSAGMATVKDVEEPYVKWVSNLLDKIHSPDIVILFGLNGILGVDEIFGWWNQTGLSVNWKKPDNSFLLSSYSKKNYMFREWSAINSNGHTMRLVMWPNHPSRHPFSSFELWKQSVDEYMSTLSDKSL